MMKLENANKLTDDDLEQVVGGNNMEQDSKFLNVLLRGRPGHCGRWGSFTVADHWWELHDAWRSVGVDTQQEYDGYFGGYEVAYYIDGKRVRQFDAWIHAEKVVGKHLKRADWDW